MSDNASKKNSAEQDLQTIKKALSEREELLRATFNQAAVGIAIADFEGRLIDANYKCAEIFGYDLEELKGLSFVDITHPDDLEKTREQLDRLVRGKIKHYSLDKRYVRKDGTTVWSHTTASVVRDADGEPHRLVGIVQDISERKRIEVSLQTESETLSQLQRDLQINQARLESIIEFSEDAIITKNLEGIIQSWNPAAQRIFGYTPEEIIGKPIRKLIPDHLQGEEDIILEKISRGERVELHETERVAKGGKKLFISVTSSPVKDIDGKIIGATKIARDVTERRRYQETLEEAHRNKDHFLATLSHELRTPLNAILGWANLALRSPENEERVKQSLTIIERNARTQAQIIEDLLDMNRILSGNFRLDMQPVDLNSIVEEAIESIRPSAQAKQLTVERTLESSKAMLSGDVTRLRQIVWNLLTNAIKFTPSGGKITVSVRSTGKKTLELVVTDTGEGIGPEFLPFIFDRFSQADTSAARKFGGLGLGLSIVRYLVETHGGKIYATSKGLGHGAIFTITLPALDRLTSSLLQTSENKTVETLAPSDILKGIHILVVDDEPDARLLVKALLEEQGATITTAGRAEDALNIIIDSDVNILVSDIAMPDEDGYQLISKVRKLSDERKKSLPAIALTAYARNSDVIRTIKAGFQTHIAKPVKPGELLAAITEVQKGLN